MNITEKHLRIPYYEYLELINDLGVSKAGKLLNDLASKSSQSSPSISSAFLILFEESLNHPNSPMRHDALYLNVVDAYIQYFPADSEERKRLIEEREILLKNRIGEIGTGIKKPYCLFRRQVHPVQPVHRHLCLLLLPDPQYAAAFL